MCDNNIVERWNLDQVTDIHGNKIFYTYNTINNEPYLTKIEYNSEKARVVNLTYSTNANPRTVNYQACTIQENQKLTGISVTTSGNTVQSYPFSYTNQINDEPLLTSITKKG